MSLTEYNKKRDFKKTSEPTGNVARADRHRFVVQKHQASRLHYDFRLELDGALKSWAVPKGIPVARGEKHLAVQVEDHPVAYIDFEGTIPAGQYGAGTVMVWDHGTYEPLSPSPARSLAHGKLHVVLHGKKLKGEWYLVRLRDEKQWLLIRGGEDLPPISPRQNDQSALSGKSMKQLAKGERLWESERASRSKKASRPAARSRTAPRAVSARKEIAPPGFIQPMKARLVSKAPSGDWLYEIKFDGFRAVALIGSSECRLMSRNEKDLGSKFPEVVESLTALDLADSILDGEIVALDEKGRSSFQLLQAFQMGERRPPIFYYAFDLLRLTGEDLRHLPVAERKARLEGVLKDPPGVIRFSASLGGDVARLLKQARELGLEGMIGKREDSRYEPGQRSGAWIKLKVQDSQEFVIGGYTDPAGSRSHFGALLVGYYEGDRFLFAGKVGTGFDDALLRSLHGKLTKLAIEECPFANLPEKRAGRYGSGLTPSEMRRCHWVQPKLVCQIKFSEWTRDGKLRQPVYEGLREDKSPKEVVRETAAAR
jgi:bifunctional non-homologous end joining protein LigD